MLAGDVEGLSAEDAAGALDETAVEVANEFPLEIGRHLYVISGCGRRGDGDT